MGSGASAGLTAAARSTSDEGLVKILAEIPPDARVKLKGVLNDLSGDGQPVNKQAPLVSDSHLPSNIEELLTEQFHLVNISGTGFINLEEMLTCMKATAELTKTKYSEKYFRSVFEKMDKSKKGKISLDDYVKYHVDVLSQDIDAKGVKRRISKKLCRVNRLLKVQATLSGPIVDALKEMFNVFDIDGSGFLTVDTDRAVSEALGIEYDEQSKQTFLNNSKDGTMALEEFMEYFRHTMLDAIVQEAGGMDGAVDVIKKQIDDVKTALAAAKIKA